MNILEFLSEFPDEQSCRSDFKTQRESEGIICKKCNCKKQYWLKAKEQWQCSQCDFRTTLRSGTLMENSKLTFQKWYMAIAFMSFSKKGMSALELQRQLGHKRYQPIWNMMHKIRQAMGKRDDLYKLTGMVEFDEGYFEKSFSSKVKLKRGKGSQKQQNVAVMAESVPLEDLETGSNSKQCRYFKMKVLQGHTTEHVNQVIQDNLDENCILQSDKSTSYVDIEKIVELHVTEKSDKTTTNNHLKWVHIAISNAKRALLGVYHKINGNYLQSYLDEFCYRLNRRYFGNNLFYRLTKAMAKSYW